MFFSLPNSSPSCLDSLTTLLSSNSYYEIAYVSHSIILCCESIQLKHASTSMLQDDGCSSYHIPRPSCHFYLALTLGDVHWLNNRKTYVW
jgi:hypothetical protein